MRHRKNGNSHCETCYKTLQVNQNNVISSLLHEWNWMVCEKHGKEIVIIWCVVIFYLYETCRMSMLSWNKDFKRRMSKNFISWKNCDVSYVPFHKTENIFWEKKTHKQRNPISLLHDIINFDISKIKSIHIQHLVIPFCMLYL